MTLPSKSFYAVWRTHFLAPLLLHDGEGPPSERLLQAVWQHQRLQRDQLKTIDGKLVRVFHPGFVSVEGGPDFGNALIQVGDFPPCSGDVEIDLHPNGWRAHGHDRNPHFQNVILQVVWEGDGMLHGGAGICRDWPPTLVLKGFLDAPLAELILALEQEPLRSLPEPLRGSCCSPLRGLDEEHRTGLLLEAAHVRLEARAFQFRARARHAGWEQALWEQLFRALGYKHNLWPMLHLAETKSHWSRGARTAFELQVRLLGVGALLPAEWSRARKGADQYLRRAWDCWWRERDGLSGCLLPPAAWKFHGVRPANHPQRRLALAAHWLADEHFISKIEGWGLEGSSGVAPPRHPGSIAESLRQILEAGRDEFWSWHWTLRSARTKKPLPLLGKERVTDLAMNVLLPWLWIRAVEGGNENLRRCVEQRYYAWPAAEDNSVLKLARQRLLGVESCQALRTAAAQQGLIQIVRDFCEHSNAVCENCRFPELVSHWNPQSPTEPQFSRAHPWTQPLPAR